jgi:hypothetical protein
MIYADIDGSHSNGPVHASQYVMILLLVPLKGEGAEYLVQDAEVEFHFLTVHLTSNVEIL